MTYATGYATGYLTFFPSGLALTGGATLASVAADGRRWRSRAPVLMAQKYGVEDVVAMDWLLQAGEAGLDIGRPRDDRRR